MPRKICMIVHQYPPDPGPTSYRMAYRAKFLQSQGYEVDVFAPGESDQTFMQSPGIHVHHVSAPASSSSNDLDYRTPKTTGLLRVPGFLRPLTGYLRWLPRLVSGLRRLDASDTVLYTYNNPVTLHLAGLVVHRRFAAWVSEFRDPIAGYEYSARGILGRLTDGWLEKRVLKNADVICMRRGIQALPEDYKQARGRVVLLPDYGVDLDLFTGFEQRQVNPERPIGVYAGTVFSDMSFSELSAGLEIYRVKQGGGEVRLFGPAHEEFLVNDNLRYAGNLGFEALLDEYRCADFVIVYDLSEHKTQSSEAFFPSKFAELIAIQRPVLFIGNLKSETARLVNSMNLGVCVSNEASAIAVAMGEIITGLQKGRFDLQLDGKKQNLIDAKAAEEAFVDMLPRIQ